MDTETLSKTIRKKISVSDDRTSSKSVGAVAIVLISLVFGTIIVLDANNLVRDIVRRCGKEGKKMMRSFYRIVLTCICHLPCLVELEGI